MKTLRSLVFALVCWWLVAPAMTAAAVETESLRRGRPGPSIITLYERPNFRGASLEVAIDETIIDLSLLRFPNGSRLDNRVSSIQLSRGAQIKIYAEDNFRGEFLDLSRSVENLGDLARAGGQSWDDAISSLRVQESRHGRPRGRDPSRLPRIIVFSNKNYKGEAFEIFPGETFTNLSREYFEGGVDLNDAISSVRVVGPLRVRLYHDRNSRGDFLDLTVDTPDLYKIRRTGSSHSWDDKASSLVVEWVGPPQKIVPEPDEKDDDDRRDPDRGKKRPGDERGNF